METYPISTYNLVSNLYKENFTLTNRGDLMDENKELVFQLNHQYTPTDLDYTFDVDIKAYANRSDKSIEFVFTFDGAELSRNGNIPPLFVSEMSKESVDNLLKDFLYKNVKELCERFVPTLKLQKLLSIEGCSQK